MEEDHRQNPTDCNVSSQAEKEEGAEIIGKKGQRDRRNDRAQFVQLREDTRKKEEVRIAEVNNIET